MDKVFQLYCALTENEQTARRDMLGRGYFKSLHHSGPEAAVRIFSGRSQHFSVGGSQRLGKDGHLLADGTGKAVGMVGLAQGSDHLALHELPAAVAPGPVHPLVVQGAQIVPVLYEEASLGQVAAAHCRETSLQVVSACQISGQHLPSPRCWWLPVLSAVWGQGRGLAQRAI